jgi:hypothetical protein
VRGETLGIYLEGEGGEEFYGGMDLSEVGEENPPKNPLESSEGSLGHRGSPLGCRSVVGGEKREGEGASFYTPEPGPSDISDTGSDMSDTGVGYI